MRCRNIVLFFSLLNTCIICGCDSSTSPSTPLPQVTTPPSVGSVFVFDTWTIDSLGNKIVGSNDIRTDSILESGITKDGKTNVARYISKHSSGYSTYGYLNIEPSGDVSQTVPIPTNGGQGYAWIIYPIRTAITQNVVLVDTIINPGPNATTMKETVSLSYNGFFNVIANDTAVTGIKIKNEISLSWSSNGMQNSIKAVSYESFAPSIAFWIQQYTPPYKFLDGKTQNGSIATLTKYTIM